MSDIQSINVRSFLFLCHSSVGIRISDPRSGQILRGHARIGETYVTVCLIIPCHTDAIFQVERVKVLSAINYLSFFLFLSEIFSPIFSVLYSSFIILVTFVHDLLIFLRLPSL